MNEFECKPNSYKSKEGENKPAEPEKRVEKVVQGKVQAKKSNVHKFTDIFISEDIANVKSYIIMDVLVPAIKKAVSDIVTNGVDMILYGETGRKKSSSGSKISYVNYYDNKRDDRRYDEPRESSSRSSAMSCDELKFEYRRDAEAILDQMAEVIDRFGYVTVSDVYDMADVTGPFTGNKYGWTSVRNGEVVHTRDGYRIKLPKAVLIDR
jgi:predicted glutamine amidotransferase